MKPPPFDYADPSSLDQAIALLDRHDGEAKLLAGGQSLMPLLNMRLARPSLLVDLRRVEGLDGIRPANAGLAIGAMTTKREVEASAHVAERQPLLLAATRLIGHPQIRNRGTVGGSLAHADPAAEYPAAAVALDAEILVAGPGGSRGVPAQDFFVGYLATDLGPADVLTELRLPELPRGTGWSMLEVARRHGDFAMAGVAVTLGLEGGRCSRAHIVPFGVGPAPVRARGAEDLLIGERPGEALYEAAARAVADAIEDPLEDVHASAEYRTHLARTLTRRALAQATSRAEAAP